MSRQGATLPTEREQLAALFHSGLYERANIQFEGRSIFHTDYKEVGKGADWMKATMRIGKGSAKHNTHSFEAEHINKERTEQNIYWTWKNGFTEEQNLIKDEVLFYEENYTDYLNRQNEKYKQRRQYAKIKNMEEYQKATPLDEMILQIGKMGETVDPEILKSVTDEFTKELENKYGDNVHIVSYAIHLDEATPHVHLRLAYDYINKDNIKQYGIDKALTALGFKKPNKEFKTVKDKDGNEIKVETESRFNNKKITFTDKLRSIFYDLCDLHLLDKGHDLINRTVENPSHRHLKAELYKAKKQQEENEKMKVENNVLKTAINQSKRELEELKKKVSNSEDENESLNNQVSSAKKELEELEQKQGEVRTKTNKIVNYMNECLKITYEAEEADLQAVGFSPLTKKNDELFRKVQKAENLLR